MANTTNRQVRTANRARLVVGGTTVGLAQNVSVDFALQHQPMSRIGSPDPEEHVPGLASYRVSFGRGMALVRDRLGGDSPGILNTNGQTALKGRVFDIVMMDDETGEAVETIHDCSHDSGSVRYDAGRIIMQNCSFIGRSREAVE